MKAESEFEKVKRGADDKGGGMELELCNICRHKHFKISMLSCYLPHQMI